MRENKGCVWWGGVGSGVVMTEGRMEGGTYRFWSATLHLVHEAVWSLPKWCSWLTPGPVDNLPPCNPLPTKPPGVLMWGHTALWQWKNHFKESVLGFTFLQWEEFDQQVAIVCLLCILLGQGLWKTLKNRTLAFSWRHPACGHDCRQTHTLRIDPWHIIVG